MAKEIRYTLGKEERLKSRKAIDHLFKEGKSFGVFPLRVLYMWKEEHASLNGSNQLNHVCRLQAGFTASSRNFKKAVDRNRVKRLMREAYRLQKNELQLLPALNNCTLTLFFIFAGKELPVYKLVYEKMGVALKRLMKLTGEKK